eukprot:CAMPEP_0196587456 /NCGR_PEP_ID=MMETSP1081-20130531/57532_1 /TAXON_ID=36882 /ORGANISM="Pyramimonas amylifera, Strain CCMP720" /LENGTH=37 /DNA_ID= /DNA_START= /DNA_END= /DNA_ORIENTATION=
MSPSPAHLSAILYPMPDAAVGSSPSNSLAKNMSIGGK